jgi:hypothetical protein
MCAYISAYIGAWEHMRPPKGEHIAYHICQFEEHILARPTVVADAELDSDLSSVSSSHSDQAPVGAG